MRILKLEIDGYRSFRSQSWEPGELNVLIGPNASGKSNLLRVLELLGAAARGALGLFVQREGGMEAVGWDGQVNQLRFQLTTTPVSAATDGNRDLITYEMLLARLGISSGYRIDRETLATVGKPENGRTVKRHDVLMRQRGRAKVESARTGRTEKFSTFMFTGDARTTATGTSVPLSDEETLLSAAAGPFAIHPLIGEFQRSLAAWEIYQSFHTDREAPIRAAQITRHETQVRSDGQNLVSVLHTLYNANRDFENEINAAMRAAFGDDFEKLTFPPAADQRIQMRIRWRSLRREQSAADLSDGTLRFLFLITLLANPSPPALVAIDEPETGLHPSMLPIIASYAREASRRTQVILTTHSPEFLDAFRDEPPTTTIVERLDGETILRNVAGEDLDYWLREYTLGELFRSNQLETMQ